MNQEGLLNTPTNDLELIRRKFFAIATFLGGAITFILVASNADLVAITTYCNIILIIVTYFLFSIRRATLLSAGFSTVSILTIFLGTTRLPNEIALNQLSQLLEPFFYFTICFYLVRALSSFRLEATSAKTEAKQFEKLAYFDELTGIANRRKLIATLQREISGSHRYNTPLSIIIFDIDHFKAVNDTYGHNVGDKVLKATDVAFELAERLRLGVADSLIENGPNITASFGIAQLIQLDNFDSLILRADQALYSAKDQGRNRCKPNPLKETIGYSFAQVNTNRQPN